MREGRGLRTVPWRCGLVAALIAGLVAGLVTVVALRMEAPLERERGAGQRAVLDLLQREIGHAVELGIPLTALPDLESHLATTLGQFPDLTAVRLEMPDGFGAAAGAPGPDDTVLSAAVGDGVLTLFRALDRSLPRLLWTAAGAVALGAGLLSALLAWLLVVRPGRRAERALAARLAAVGAGDFTDEQLPASGLPTDALADELDEWRRRVLARNRLLRQQAAGVRAIDYDGTLGPKVDAVLAELDARYRFPDATA
jgi:hypothetical protein